LLGYVRQSTDTAMKRGRQCPGAQRAKGVTLNTKDGYRTTVEAGRTALARARDLLWASVQHAWAQLTTRFRQ
jgi:hypothetical protein